MELYPFRALRYDPACVGLAEVAAPPYDVIDKAQCDALYRRNPYNAVRLILNRDADRYASSARHLAEWIEAGVLRRESEPALWLYVQDFQYAGARFERSGLIGTVRLEPLTTGRIRPHERTLSGPKEDRRRLLEACRVNFSPIFGLCADAGHVIGEVRAALQAVPTAADLTDEFDVRHRLWRIASGAQVERVRRALAEETIFIADGHHRYETALAYRDRLVAGGQIGADDAANFIMMYLCSLDDPGLLVLPTHRILRALAGLDPTAFIGRLRNDFEVRPLPRTAAGRDELLARLANGGVRGLFGIALQGADALYSISPRTDRPNAIDREAAEVPPEVRHLDVTILDRLILRGVLGIDADGAARAGQLRYSHDAADAFDSVDSGNAQVAFLLAPPDLRQVQSVCLSGGTMPQKSTYFHPKLLTGLLFNPLSDDVGARRPAAERAGGR